MTITLRPYQEKFVADLAEAFRRNRRVCGVAPTGAGKTVVFSFLANGAAAKGNDVLIIAHRARIIAQISATLHRSNVRHGRIQRGYTQTDDLVQVGMVKTIGNRLARIKPPRFIIVDEGHHAVAAGYQKILDAFPDAKVLLVTATPERPDGKGLKEVADVLVEAIPMRELIEIGALARYRYMAPAQLVDLSQVRERGGDYAADELAEAMNKTIITGSAIDNYVRYMNGETAVIFCVNVKHAQDVAAQFNAAGIPATSVDGKLDEAVVDERLDDVGVGRIKVITSCDLISEGVDVPGLRGVFLLMATKSVVKYLQAVGRALRPKPDGGYAWIFDHTGNYARHGFPDMEREWSLEGQKKKRKNAIKVVGCESCPKIFQKYPGWREEWELCVDPEGPCVLAGAPEAAPRKPPEQRDGELREVVGGPEWAPRNISIADAKGNDFKRIVRAAKTEEALAEIARIRGFKNGWVKHIMESRRGH